MSDLGDLVDVFLDQGQGQGRQPHLMVAEMLERMQIRLAPIGSTWRRKGWNQVLRVGGAQNAIVFLELLDAERVQPVNLVDLLKDWEMVHEEPEEMGDCPECGNGGWSPVTMYPTPCSTCAGASASAGGMPVRVGGVPREDTFGKARASEGE